MIPKEAIEAAAKVLLGYTGACVCHEAYTGRNLIDPDCRYHDVPPEVAKEILEAAAPHMLDAAFDQGQKSGMRHADRLVAAAKIGRPELPGPISPNPYRTTL